MVRSQYGWTALHYAALNNNESLCRRLVRQGGDVFTKDNLNLASRKPRRPIDLCGEELRQTLLAEHAAVVNWSRRRSWVVFSRAVQVAGPVGLRCNGVGGAKESILRDPLLMRFMTSFL